uniref:Uncharacterized protein n=1 Tax=Anguilla anguilla TaxID=7936 RepID=A0A0E9W2I9_ANGAN
MQGQSSGLQKTPARVKKSTLQQRPRARLPRRGRCLSTD